MYQQINPQPIKQEQVFKRTTIIKIAFALSILNLGPEIYLLLMQWANLYFDSYFFYYVFVQFPQALIFFITPILLWKVTMKNYQTLVCLYLIVISNIVTAQFFIIQMEYYYNYSWKQNENYFCGDLCYLYNVYLGLIIILIFFYLYTFLTVHKQATLFKKIRQQQNQAQNQQITVQQQPQQQALYVNYQQQPNYQNTQNQTQGYQQPNTIQNQTQQNTNNNFQQAENQQQQIVNGYPTLQ